MLCYLLFNKKMNSLKENSLVVQKICSELLLFTNSATGCFQNVLEKIFLKLIFLHLIFRKKYPLWDSKVQLELMLLWEISALTESIYPSILLFTAAPPALEISLKFHGQWYVCLEISLKFRVRVVPP